MIPPEFYNPRTAAVLLEYLRDEITRALNERRPLEERWARWHRTYKAQPETEVREFPFKGAANIVIPVAATDVDIVAARLLGVLFTPENLWTSRPLRPDAVAYTPRVTEFMRWAQDNELGAYGSTRDWVTEICKLGTGVLKQRYRREQRLVYEFREMGSAPGMPSMGGQQVNVMQRVRRAVLKDHPVQQWVPLENFLVPSIATELEDAPWCAERITLTWTQLQERVRSGLYQGADRLAGWHAQFKGTPLDFQRQTLDRFVPTQGTGFELWEAWLRFDITGSGEPMELVCTIHLPTMTYLRLDFNPFFHQEKPYEVARYMHQEGRFYGIGLCEMNDPFQDEVTTQHRQRLDNHTIANTPMLWARKNVGIKEGEAIIPGRWILTDNPEDIKPLTIGRNFDSSIQDEEMTLSYSARRTGVNDYVSGSSSPSIGYAALGTNMIQQQEASKRFDQTLREIRKGLGRSGQRLLELYQQFHQGGKPFTVLGPEDGSVVTQVLQFPMELIRASVAVEVTATSASLNKEVEIRTNTILMQLVDQHFQKALQAMQIALNPQVPEPMRLIALQMISGSGTLLRRTLDSYNVQDAATILPRLEEFLNAGQQQNPAGFGGPSGGLAPQQGALGGGGQPTLGPVPVGGMAAGPPGFG